MLPVRMVQVPAHQIVGVISVQYGFVPTIGSMDVAGVMCATLVVGCTAILIGWPVQFVFVDMISMYVVQVTVVKIIGVAIVPDGGVAAIRTVRVRVSFLFHAGLGHLSSFLAVVSRKNNRNGRTGALADLNPGWT
jgi:hypothetical protein